MMGADVEWLLPTEDALTVALTENVDCDEGITVAEDGPEENGDEGSELAGKLDSGVDGTLLLKIKTQWFTTALMLYY